MRKTAYTKTILIFFVSVLLYWCWIKNNEVSNDVSQIQSNILENKLIKKYNTISSSGNIYENMKISVHWTSSDLDIKFDLVSDVYKNLNTDKQNGDYNFQMISEKYSLDEIEIISWFVKLVSDWEDYFVRPQNIYFSGPKGKYSNKEIESKIAKIQDSWIKIDKEIPFKTTSESILYIQKLLRTPSEVQFNSQSWSVSITTKDGLIDGELSSNNWIFYLSSGQIIQVSKSWNRFKLYLSWHESDTNLDIKIKNWFNNLILKFEWNINYKYLSPLSSEIKLDIKWKYVIKDTWYVQSDLPKDYLNLTQTSLKKK